MFPLQDFLACYLGSTNLAEVWTQHFARKLAIRPRSQHKECGCCVRHKAILRRLANDRNGRQAQMEEYSRHLNRQLSDRRCYWQARAVARLGGILSSGNQVVSIICDAIDHSKFRFPRSDYFQSKDLDGMMRPMLDLTCALAHGHGVFLFPSLVFVQKNSNLMADILSYTLHRLVDAGRVSQHSLELLLQTDNTTREWKNNCLLRLIATYVGGHRMKRGELRCLMTGHSHEDVDQYFSTMSNHIQTYRELHRPSDFVHCLQDLHRNTSIRPNEPLREVHLVSTTREWTLSTNQQSLVLLISG